MSTVITPRRNGVDVLAQTDSAILQDGIPENNCNPVKPLIEPPRCFC